MGATSRGKRSMYGTNITPGTGLLVLSSTVVGGYLPTTGGSVTPFLLVGAAFVFIGICLTFRAHRFRPQS
jgi:hypothetical protein